MRDPDGPAAMTRHPKTGREFIVSSDDMRRGYLGRSSDTDTSEPTS